VWLWEYETDEGAHDLYMDQGEEIRFRVTDEVFLDTSPSGPAPAPVADTPAPGQQPDQPDQPKPPAAEDSGQKKEAPYTLVVRTKKILNTLFIYFFIFYYTILLLYLMVNVMHQISQKHIPGKGNKAIYIFFYF